MANDSTVRPAESDVPFDLEAYFDRIDYAGEREPNLDTLRRIALQHATRIPFENLNPLMGWPVRLDLASLQEKLLRNERGGYCFEQNSLLSWALRSLGFQVRHLAARVVWNQPEDVRPARSHMVLRVDLDGQVYLTDVGFGAMTPTGPLRFDAGIEQDTPHGPFRLRSWENVHLLQAWGAGEWRPLYRIDLVEQFPADYELYNWYAATHPESPFTRSLIAARADVGKRYTLTNTELNTYSVGGGREQQILRGVEELRQVLQELFHLRLPETTDLDPALRRIVETAPG